MSLLELLQKGDVVAFNDQRSARTRPDLFAAELPEAKLGGADLSAANLEKADLTGADLTDATLVRAELSGADGTGINLSGVLGLKVRMKGSWFDEAILDNADLSRGDLSEINLCNSRGEGLRLVGARLRHADCKAVTWPDVDLSEARLHHCDLAGSDLSRADMTECVATECVLTGCRIDGLMGTRANLNESKLDQTSMVGAVLQEASLSRCDLTGANLTGADLTRANLSGAVLAGTILSNACLADANLEGVDLSTAVLDGADLTGHDPKALGLDDAAIAKLSAWGAPVVEDAPIVITEPAAARSGDKVAVLWLNPDTETLSTLRWGLIGGKKPVLGVLPMSAEGVLARMVIANDEGFALLFVQDRPGGAVLVRVPLALDGTIGASASLSLGYVPAVVPVAQTVDGALRLTGLARRGPTLVVQQHTSEGLQLVHSEGIPTASGFYSAHHPVVATRGGVVIGIGADGAGKPVRTPEGFPGKAARVVQWRDELVAIWFEANPDPDEPGRICWSELGGRGAPEVMTLKEAHRVTSLDAVAADDGIHVAWIEAQGLLSALTFTAHLPTGKLKFIEAAGDAAHEVRWAPGAGEGPVLLVGTLEDQVIALEGGKRVGVLGD